MVKGFYFILLFILVFVQHKEQYEIDATRIDDISSELSLTDFDGHLQLAFHFDLEEFEDNDFEGEADLVIAFKTTDNFVRVRNVYFSNHYSSQFIFHFSDSSPPSFIAS